LRTFKNGERKKVLERREKGGRRLGQEGGKGKEVLGRIER